MQAIRRKLYKLRTGKDMPKKEAAKPKKEFKTARTADVEQKLRDQGVDEEVIQRMRGKSYKGPK